MKTSKTELLKSWERSGLITQKAVLDAFCEVNREDFVIEKFREDAYGDFPLSIGYEQTISQPTTVVLMSQFLDLSKGDRVLEIGSGSGYSAAIISRIVGDRGFVFTTEIIGELADFAKNNLKKSGIANVKVKHTDGSFGLPRYAPFDRVIITAAAPDIPPPITNQLKDGGILVAPVGKNRFCQKMLRAIRRGKDLQIEELGSFVFVPLRGKYGFSKE